MKKEQTQNHAQGFKSPTSADIFSMQKHSWRAFQFGDMVDNFPIMGTQLAIFLQRYTQATVLPLERKGSPIEMQPVISPLQKTHSVILSSERNSQQFSHGG